MEYLALNYYFYIEINTIMITADLYVTLNYLFHFPLFIKNIKNVK